MRTQERAVDRPDLPAQPPFPGPGAQAVARRGAPRSCRPATTSTRHFSPTYDPWDQRLCVVPERRPVPGGARGARVGRHRPHRHADRARRRARLGRRAAGGRTSSPRRACRCRCWAARRCAVDGRDVDLGRAVVYKGVMLSGVPNFALTFGYTNASWTLKADLAATYVCRLLRHLRAHGGAVATPTAPSDDDLAPLIALRSGYVHAQRGPAAPPGPDRTVAAEQQLPARPADPAAAAGSTTAACGSRRRRGSRSPRECTASRPVPLRRRHRGGHRRREWYRCCARGRPRRARQPPRVARPRRRRARGRRSHAAGEPLVAVRRHLRRRSCRRRRHRPCRSGARPGPCRHDAGDPQRGRRAGGAVRPGGRRAVRRRDGGQLARGRDADPRPAAGADRAPGRAHRGTVERVRHRRARPGRPPTARASSPSAGSWSRCAASWPPPASG